MEQINQNIKEDFIGIYPNAASADFCERAIQHFEWLQKTQANWSTKRVHDRQLYGSPKIWKDDSSYSMHNHLSTPTHSVNYYPETADPSAELMDLDYPIMQEWSSIAFQCYQYYKQEHHCLTDPGFGAHRLSPFAKIQKSEVGQGYHLWHCETGALVYSRRIVVVALYLNTVEEGGETEFLVQHVRKSPEQGTMVMFPAGWTHPHRGNPPLNEAKYFLTSWIEFVFPLEEYMPNGDMPQQ